MTTYKFKSTGITLNEILVKVGIETTVLNGAKYLSFNGKDIARPLHSKCEQVVKEQFGINIIYTK